MTGPQPRDEKIRLAGIISDARQFLAATDEPVSARARLSEAEALLKMLADSAEAFTPYTGGSR